MQTRTKKCDVWILCIKMNKKRSTSSFMFKMLNIFKMQATNFENIYIIHAKMHFNK
jgi:hypothetical protein